MSLHLRLTPETRGFLTRRELALMKKTAFLINTGRGALVEREALLDALRRAHRRRRARRLPRGAAEARRPVLALPNVVLSPHNAGQTPR